MDQHRQFMDEGVTIPYAMVRQLKDLGLSVLTGEREDGLNPCLLLTGGDRQLPLVAAKLIELAPQYNLSVRRLLATFSEIGPVGDTTVFTLITVQFPE